MLRSYSVQDIAEIIFRDNESKIIQTLYQRFVLEEDYKCPRSFMHRTFGIVSRETDMAFQSMDQALRDLWLLGFSGNQISTIQNAAARVHHFAYSHIQEKIINPHPDHIGFIEIGADETQFIGLFLNADNQTKIRMNQIMPDFYNKLKNKFMEFLQEELSANAAHLMPEQAHFNKRSLEAIENALSELDSLS